MSPLCHVQIFFFLLKEYSKCGGKRVFWQFRNLGLDTWCSACGQVFCKHLHLQSCFQVQKDLFFVLCPFILILSLHRFNTKLSGGIKFYKKWGFLALWGAYEMGEFCGRSCGSEGEGELSWDLRIFSPDVKPEWLKKIKNFVGDVTGKLENSDKLWRKVADWGNSAPVT